MKKILLDTSSAILLFKTGLCEQLFEVYQVAITESVFNELTREDYPGKIEFQRWLGEKKYWLLSADQMSDMDGISPKKAAGLDRGELDTISFYKIGYGDFVITDDGKAAAHCKKHEIPFINGLLFPKALYFSDRISAEACNKDLEFLCRIGRYSDEIMTWAKNCSKKSLEFFLP
jgi:hypothetical protein